MGASARSSPRSCTSSKSSGSVGKVANGGLESFFLQSTDQIESTRAALAAVGPPAARDAYEKALAALPPGSLMSALREVAAGTTDAAKATLAAWHELNLVFHRSWEPTTAASGEYLLAHLKELDLPPLPPRDSTQECYRSPN